MDRTALLNAPDNERLLGIFSQSNMPVWLDRNVYTNNLLVNNAPNGSNASALNLPGLKDMTIKAIDVLQSTNDGAGWFLMSEVLPSHYNLKPFIADCSIRLPSIDKQLHIFDYDRALGDMLEFDDTINATLTHLQNLGILNNTLVIVTADHAQAYDVS